MEQTPIAAGPLEASVSRLQEENRILRYLLAMAHDSEKHRIYGDDGELQCSVCWVDFVRDSAQEIQRKIEAAGMRELQRMVEAGEWPPKPANVELTGSRAGLSPVSPATEGSEVERRVGPLGETP